LGDAWERFARADATRAQKGSGLGLAIVRTIAAARAGNAKACNLPGGGADVWIALPLPSRPRLARSTLTAPSARPQAASDAAAGL
jgi:two-component system OmpR family sensor kinase